jgi:cystathionine beta-lyase/cystathionine gamma-synthase
MKNQRKPARASLATRAIHGNKLYPHKGPLALPIYQTSTYRFESSDDAIRYAKGDPSVYVYSRYHNPTVNEVEEKLALLEGTESAALFASGMAAISTTMFALVKSGEEIVSSPALYGGTYRFFRDELPKQHIAVRYFNPGDWTTLSQSINAKTRIVYFETPTNPTLSILDIEKLVATTKQHEKRNGRIYTMIDNTFASILNQDPLSFGVDIVMESATKYLGGHSDILSGVVMSSHEIVKRIKTAAKSFGGCADPFAAFLLGRSLKTFELRVQRQNENALTLAGMLEKHPKVKRVLYPGLPSHPSHAVAKRQMNGFGGMVTIEVNPSKKLTPVEAAVRVCDSLRVAVNAMSLGGVETLVSIPVYSSHIFMTDAELKLHGVTPGMIRISVGVEGIDDLIEDFRQALSKI